MISDIIAKKTWDMLFEDEYRQVEKNKDKVSNVTTLTNCNTNYQSQTTLLILPQTKPSEKFIPEKVPGTHANLGQIKTQIKIHIKQIDFILKTCNYTKECKLLDLNSEYQ